MPFGQNRKFLATTENHAMSETILAERSNHNRTLKMNSYLISCVFFKKYRRHDLERSPIT